MSLLADIDSAVGDTLRAAILATYIRCAGIAEFLGDQRTAAFIRSISHDI